MYFNQPSAFENFMVAAIFFCGVACVLAIPVGVIIYLASHLRWV